MKAFDATKTLTKFWRQSGYEFSSLIKGRSHVLFSCRLVAGVNLSYIESSETIVFFLSWTERTEKGSSQEAEEMSELVARTGRHLQRYKDGCRLIAGYMYIYVLFHFLSVLQK